MTNKFFNIVIGATLLFIFPSYASRKISFSTAYTNRCPIDRTNAVVTIHNISSSDQDVRVTGGRTAYTCNGSCGQFSGGTYNGFTVSNVGTLYPFTAEAAPVLPVVTLGGISYHKIAAGKVGNFFAGSGTGALCGVFQGDIEVYEDTGALIASGIIDNVQDSATLFNNPPGPGNANYQFPLALPINGGRPF